MLHVARSYVASRASAEEVVQETWLAVVRGLDGFEGRSSLRTWTFRVLANIARRQGVREYRVVASGQPADGDPGRAVPADRFRPAGEPWAGGWRAEAAPRAWGPEAAVLGGEARALLDAALSTLPPRQRVVVQLRDVDGLDAEEVCAVLGLTPANQRVLLHRARAKLREQLAVYYSEHGEAAR